MMYLQREKINYLCKKYNLKVCRVGDTYKLFIHSSIFPASNYWYIFANEDLVGWDWILEFDSKSIMKEYQYIKILNTQTLAEIHLGKSVLCGKTKYELNSTGQELNYKTEDELVALIESFINDIKKLEKTLEVESKLKDLEKDFK